MEDRGGELRIGIPPKPLDVHADADQDGAGSQGHEGHEQRVLKQVLSTFVVAEPVS